MDNGTKDKPKCECGLDYEIHPISNMLPELANTHYYCPKCDNGKHVEYRKLTAKERDELGN